MCAYRLIFMRTVIKTIHMDEFVDLLLTQDYVCDVVLPRLPKRAVLELTGQLKRRVYVVRSCVMLLFAQATAGVR